MIIFDYNQVAISNLMEQIGYSKTEVQEDLVRHMILNTIRTYVKKFKKTHGPEVILACDNKNYWRKELFPNYKASRKRVRETSGHDWNVIFECLNKIRDELKENSPYKVIEIDTCEADDIIATIVTKYSANEKIMILSSDKDFAQLQKFKNVEQYSPILKKYVKEELPSLQLKQLIIRGDKGDGIPNIMSPDDVFVTGRASGTATTNTNGQMDLAVSNHFNYKVPPLSFRQYIDNFKKWKSLILSSFDVLTLDYDDIVSKREIPRLNDFICSNCDDTIINFKRP